MKYKLIIDETKEEEIIIYAHNRSELVSKIEKIINTDNKKIYGYRENEIVYLDINIVNAFYIEDGKTYATIDNNKYLVKYRIYELEEILDDNYIKINQSCLGNINQIKKFKACFNGSLEVIFKNGFSDYISRRELKKVKERLGL